MDDLVALRESAEFLRTVKATKGQDDAQFSLASVRLQRAAARIQALETSLAEAEGTIAVLRERLANSMPIAGGNPFRSAGCSALASDPLLDRQGKEGL